MPNTPQISTQMSFDDAPGGDLSFDDLFPPDGATQQTTAPDPAPVDQSQAAPDPFLKTSSGTIYKTKEEAASGIEHKDALIEKLRQAEIARTGVDPLTGKQVKPAQTSQGSADAPVSYLQQQDRYFQDLHQAVEKNDAKSYFQAQQKLVFDTLSPIAPIIQNFAKTQAIEQVSNEIKDFRSFVGTPEYKEAVESFAGLKQVIDNAEADLNYSHQLPELYKLAYFAARGKAYPETVKTQSTQQQPSRPTLSPTTSTPPSAFAPQESLNNSEGRKSIISRMEKQGIGDFKW